MVGSIEAARLQIQDLRPFIFCFKNTEIRLPLANQVYKINNYYYGYF